MSKPHSIKIVRHGESEGNVNRQIYAKVPDYALRLTPNGLLQARMCGQRLRQQLDGDVMFYVSPQFRARDTHFEIAKFFPGSPVREEPLIREQDWGSNLREVDAIADWEKEREQYGAFYFRFHRGESGCDVYDRVSDFIGVMHRDFERSDYPKNAIIVTHGFTARVLLMRWLHLSVEQFELLSNPPNCGTYSLRLGADDHYVIAEPPPQYHQVKHGWRWSPPVSPKLPKITDKMDRKLEFMEFGGSVPLVERNPQRL